MQTYHNKQYGAHAATTASGDATAQNNYGKALLIGTYCVYGLAGVFFIAVCCLWKAIRVSVAILKTTAVIIIRNLKLLVMPFLSTCTILCWMLFSLHNFGYLLSSGTITQPKRGSQLKRVELTD